MYRPRTVMTGLLGLATGLTLGLAGASASFAQEADEDRAERAQLWMEQRGERGDGERGMRGRGRGMGMMIRELELSEDQRTELFAVVRENREQVNEHLTAMREHEQTLTDLAMEGQGSDEQIREAADQLAEAAIELRAVAAQVRGEVEDVLDAEQIEALQALGEEGRGAMQRLFGGGMRGMGGRGGRGGGRGAEGFRGGDGERPAMEGERERRRERRGERRGGGGRGMR